MGKAKRQKLALTQKYRSGVKNPHLEVHLFESDSSTKVYIVDWKKRKVKKLEK